MTVDPQLVFGKLVNEINSLNFTLIFDKNCQMWF